MDEKMTATLTPPFTSRPLPPKRDKSLPHAPLENGEINPPQTFDVSNPSLTALESLPTIFGRGSSVYLCNDDVASFLDQDLDLERLNHIHNLLWMAGRPMRARPLHRYKMMGFDLLQTQQMDLHLLKFSNKLLVKPLPEWILDHKFWEDHICAKQYLHEAASGFLLSYIWLLATPLDLKFAHEHYLLPPLITWHWWKEFVIDFAAHIDMNALDQVNIRFHFGELRLGRINTIYRTRFMFTHFVRGYLYGYNRYVVFFQRNFSWILIVFVFFSLVLSAMQVGAGVEPLQSNPAFLRASYGFVVFSIVSVAAILSVVGVIFLFIFVFNMAAAISHDKKERRERERLAQERKNKSKNA